MQRQALPVDPPTTWDGVFALFHELWGLESTRPAYELVHKAQLDRLRQGLEHLRLQHRLVHEEVWHQRRRVDRLYVVNRRHLEDLQAACQREAARVDLTPDRV